MRGNGGGLGRRDGSELVANDNGVKPGVEAVKLDHFLPYDAFVASRSPPFSV